VIGYELSRQFFVPQNDYPKVESAGVDFDIARELGLHVIWALSLPGKIAPVSSGQIIKNTIVNIMNEMGV
jgi:hypothetical protein